MDYQNASDLMWRLSPGGGEHFQLYFKLLVLETKNLLDHWWHQVEWLANALLERETIIWDRDIKEQLMYIRPVDHVVDPA